MDYDAVDRKISLLGERSFIPVFTFYIINNNKIRNFHMSGKCSGSKYLQSSQRFAPSAKSEENIWTEQSTSGITYRCSKVRVCTEQQKNPANE